MRRPIPTTPRSCAPSSKWAAAWACRSSPKASKPKSSATSCCTAAASWARAACSGTRSAAARSSSCCCARRPVSTPSCGCRPESKLPGVENSPGMYSIKAVSQATGLTVETLRAWERRYRVVSPRRDDLGRRLYGPDDVLRLRRLREATERGHPIGRLVQMDEVALANLLHEPEPRRQGAAASAFVERILDAARRFAAAECEQALTLAVSLMTPARLIDEVLEP